MSIHIAPPRNFHATNILRVVLSVALVFATLPIQSNSQSTKPKDKPERRIKTLPRAADLRNIEQTKQDGRIDKSKLAPVAAPTLPPATRCRPADERCKEFWKKKGIGQAAPIRESGIVDPFAQLLATNFLSTDVGRAADYRAVSDLPFSLGASAAATPVMMQGGGVSYGTMPTEMAQRRNLTGGSAEDLFARNFHWSLPIVGLPGRAGHDLGLSLHYNSHVWVKTAGNIMMLRDYSEEFANPGFGFSVGLPVLRSGSHLNRLGQTAWLVVMPTGRAIEMVRRGATNVYEATDGSLLHLVVEGSSDRFLYYPNGTRLRFNGQFCTEIRDRNGNLLTATYDPTYGLLTKLTDTAGRELTFHYYDNQTPAKDFYEAGYTGYFALTDIRQVRKDYGAPHCQDRKSTKLRWSTGACFAALG